MISTNSISQFMIKAVSQRKRLIKTGKSNLSASDIHRTLVFLKCYAEEIKDRKRMARFFITHYDRIRTIAPPSWRNKAHELFNECQIIINS